MSRRRSSNSSSPRKCRPPLLLFVAVCTFTCFQVGLFLRHFDFPPSGVVISSTHQYESKLSQLSNAAAATATSEVAVGQFPDRKPSPDRPDVAANTAEHTVEKPPDIVSLARAAWSGADAVKSPQKHGASTDVPLTIAVAAGMEQLDGTLVVINSAAKHSSSASLLRFRILTLKSEKDELLGQLLGRLPIGLDIECLEFDKWLPRVTRLLGGNSSGRTELFNPLNFAAFYVHEVFPSADRVLYLDTDVVVLGDLHRELANFDFQGHPAAAAKDCSQLLGKYVDFKKVRKKRLAKLLKLPLMAKADTCVANRGVVLVNVKKWKQLDICGEIEVLVDAHLSRKGPFWRSGVSQPPFLMTVSGRYQDLGMKFNVRGLGRGDISPEEVDFLKGKQLWNAYFENFTFPCEFNCCAGCQGYALSPFVSPLAHVAKIVHFNGRNKPDKLSNWSAMALAPPARNMSNESRSAHERIPLCTCGDNCLRQCASIWWENYPGVKPM